MVQMGEWMWIIGVWGKVKIISSLALGDKINKIDLESCASPRKDFKVVKKFLVRVECVC